MFECVSTLLKQNLKNSFLNAWLTFVFIVSNFYQCPEAMKVSMQKFYRRKFPTYGSLMKITCWSFPTTAMQTTATCLHTGSGMWWDIVTLDGHCMSTCTKSHSLTPMILLTLIPAPLSIRYCRLSVWTPSAATCSGVSWWGERKWTDFEHERMKF